MGYMERSTWNSFHVSSNVLYFVYVNLMEDFPQNSSSIFCSPMYLSFVDKLVYGELPSLYNSVVNGWVSLYVLVLGRADISVAFFGRRHKDKQYLCLSPLVTPLSLCCLSNFFFFEFYLWLLTCGAILKFINHVVSSFKKSTKWLLLVGCVVSYDQLCCL